MSDDRRISFVPGPGQWAEVTWAPGCTALVHFELNPDKKTWRVGELRLLSPTSEAVRTLPLSRIETAANAGLGSLGLAIGRTTKAPADIAGHFARERKRAHANERAGRFLLEKPRRGKLDSGFYVRVARAYNDAAAAGLNPRQTLARDTGSSPDTVARWVGEARRRGYLPAGQPGRVTAGETPALKAERKKRADDA